jgi:hypothetical protein
MNIKDNPGWKRNGGALINNDNEAYRIYKEKRKRLKKESDKIVELENRIRVLEEKIDGAIRTFENKR